MRVAALLLLCASLEAQPTRSAYQAAYKAWREADPSLERDAAGGGSPIADRAARAAAEAEKFGRARSDFYHAARAECEQKAKWAEGLDPLAPTSLASVKTEADFVAAEIIKLSRNIKSFAVDRDPGIERLRQAMERERAALEELMAGIEKREKSIEKFRTAAAATDPLRVTLIEQYRGIAEALKQGGDESERETSLWSGYYQRISDAARGVATAPVEMRPGIKLPEVRAPGAVETGPPEPAAGKPVPRLTPGGVSMNRYLGGWSFPTTNGMFFGAEPEFVDLIVREDGGRVSGSLYARFKLPPGSQGDPLVRFEFKGPLGPGRTQKFDLETNDGASGAIELIPGPAVNLLEVNFQIEPRPNKIRQSNVVLLKK